MYFNGTKFYFMVGRFVGWLFGCGLTSHQTIFQLYSDGAVRPASGHPMPWAARGL